MNNLVMAKAAEVQNMNQDELEQLKQDIGLSSISKRAEMYLLRVIEEREMYLMSRDSAVVENGELKEGEM